MENNHAWRWCKSLKCSICLDYFNRPHTLKCGHSYCIGCLTRLAEIASNQNPDENTRRLKVLCPTCRRAAPARAIVKNRLTVNYSLQEFVDNWLLQQNEINEQAVVRLRSIGSQSGDECEDESTASEDESCDVSCQIFSELPARYYPCRLSSSESQVVAEQLQQRQNSKENNLDDTGNDSDESLSSREDAALLIPNNNEGAQEFTDVVRNVIADLRDFVGDVIRCPNRSIMALVWSGYTFSIMMISTGFFPYMMLYSVLFFLILYAESVEQRRQNRH